MAEHASLIGFYSSKLLQSSPMAPSEVEPTFVPCVLNPLMCDQFSAAYGFAGSIGSTILFGDLCSSSIVFLILLKQLGQLMCSLPQKQLRPLK